MFGFIILLALMIPLLAVVLDSQLGRALAARLERPVRGESEAVAKRLAALEAEVDRLSREVERLEAQSDFLQRLLESKPATGGTLPAGESTDRSG